MQALEIQIDGPLSEACFFRPLQRSIRGSFDLTKSRETNAIVEFQKWGGPIPGQTIGISAEGFGFIREPLHEPQYAAIRERIEKRLNKRLEPDVQMFEQIHVPSWLHWLKAAVDAGLARIVKGKLPDTIEGTPQMNFVTGDDNTSIADKLTLAMQEQTAAFKEMTASNNRIADAILSTLQQLASK